MPLSDTHARARALKERDRQCVSLGATGSLSTRSHYQLLPSETLVFVEPAPVDSMLIIELASENPAAVTAILWAPASAAALPPARIDTAGSGGLSVSLCLSLCLSVSGLPLALSESLSLFIPPAGPCDGM